MHTPLRTRASRHTGLLSVLWTTPALLFYGLFALLPLLVALYLSCVQWNGLGQVRWVGAGNWIKLLSDGVTGHAVVLSLLVMLVTWLIQTPISLLLGLFMAGAQRYRALLSVFYVVPLLFSTVALGITWVSILDPNFGVVNVLLRALGLGWLAQGWLGDPNLALPVVILLMTWQFIPFHALLYQAGARQIPRELYEAAEIDGANQLRNFFAITLPQLRYTIITSTTLILTGSLTCFDIVWVTTGGGPGYATRVLPLQMYITAFPGQQIGYGSMLAVLLVLIGVALSLILLRLTNFARMSSQLEGL